MKILSWNCRGLGRASAKHRLRTLLFKLNPCIVILQETKLASSKLSFLLNWGVFVNYWAVDPKGSKGGLCILWNSVVSINVISSSAYWIDCVITPTVGDCFFFSAVYGPPNLADRQILWDHLLQTNCHNDPWLLCGDFNQVLSKRDKISRCDTSRGCSKLKNTLHDRGLTELSVCGGWFTWTNNRKEDNVV